MVISMEAYSFLMFAGGLLVGMGVLMFLMMLILYRLLKDQ
jgi:hypothetical protein